MPYLTKERKTFLGLNPNKASEEGDWNYLFTLGIIKEWESAPCYATIHKLRKACFYDSTASVSIWAIEQNLLALNLQPGDIKVAKELAFNEFMRRIGNKYEDNKIKSNGDVYPNDVTSEYLGTPSAGLVRRAKKEKK